MAGKKKTKTVFSMNSQQARVMHYLANGEPLHDILLAEFGVDNHDRSHDNLNAIRRAEEKIRKWKNDPACQDLYRRLIMHTGMDLVGKANRVVSNGMDSSNEWVALQSAQAAYARYGDMVMGEDTKETVIRIEGMPTLGTPGEDGEDE